MCQSFPDVQCLTSGLTLSSDQQAEGLSGCLEGRGSGRKIVDHNDDDKDEILCMRKLPVNRKTKLITPLYN